MSGLFGGGQSNHTYADKLAGIQLMTSTYGKPFAVVLGTARVPLSLIYYQDFKAIPHTQTQKVGKGGGSTMSNTTYTYTAAVILAIGNGRMDRIVKFWADKDRVDNPASTGFTFFPGDPVQSPWGYVTSKHPAEAVGYGGVAYVAHSAVDLGDAGSLKNYSVEVQATVRDAANGLDVYASTAVVDVLTNARYGMGWAPGRIHQRALADFSAYCVAAGIFISPVFDEQRPGIEWLGDLLRVANAAAVPSQGALKLVPYQDQQVGSWVPVTTPIYDLGADDFLAQDGEDPIEVDRSTQTDAYNRVQVEFRNRLNDYNVEVAEATDQANVEAFGLRPMDPIKLHMITEAEVARAVAQRILQRVLYVRNVYRFKLGPRHMLLEPMDLVTLLEAELGLDRRAARLVSVEDDESGEITVEVEEWPFGVAHATLYPSASGTGGGVDPGAVPGDVLQWDAMEAPGTLTEGRVEVWIGARGGDQWGGAEVWISRDGNSYAMAGTINAPARFGTLAATFPAAPTTQGVDTTSTLQMTGVSGQWVPFSDADAAKFAGLIHVDGEICSYQDATLTGAGAYTLARHRRGLHGTPSGAHAAGRLVMRLDDALLHLDAAKWDVGSTIYVKFRSFNLLGQQKQDLAQVQAKSFQILGLVRRWPAPSACSITIAGGGTTGGGGGATLTGALASIRYSTITAPGSVSSAYDGGTTSLSRPGASASYYLFTLAAGATIRATLESAPGTDTWLTLWKSDSTEIQHNDDAGGVTYRSEVQATLPAGTYVLEATLYNGTSTAAFTLTLG